MLCHRLTRTSASIIIAILGFTGPSKAVELESRRIEFVELISMDSVHPLSPPNAVATAFARELPERLLLRNDADFLSTPTPDYSKILVFFAGKRIQDVEVTRGEQWFCYLGGNRGFCAIVETGEGGADVLWSLDGLRSFHSPRIEFVELTGDSTREIVLSGLPGLGPQQAGEVFAWNGSSAQRLTEESKGFYGDYWEYVPLDKLGAKGILLHNSGRDTANKKMSWTQLLRFDPDRNAIIASPRQIDDQN